MKDLRAPFIRFKDKSPDIMFKGVRTPFYAIDEAMLIRNGKIIKGIQERTNAKILLALKCFSNYDLFSVLEPYIAGTEASGLFEARLGREEMPNKEVHVFCGAYRDDEIDEVLKYADHIVFNSINQLKKYKQKSHSQKEWFFKTKHKLLFNTYFKRTIIIHINMTIIFNFIFYNHFSKISLKCSRN